MKTVLIERDIAEPGPGQLLVQAMASGICGTDLHNLPRALEPIESRDPAVKKVIVQPSD